MCIPLSGNVNQQSNEFFYRLFCIKSEANARRVEVVLAMIIFFLFVVFRKYIDTITILRDNKTIELFYLARTPRNIFGLLAYFET